MTAAQTKNASAPKTAEGARPLLENGDRLDQPTFHRLYEQMPPGTRAELINGVVYMAAALRTWHGRPHAILMTWLTIYDSSTPGCSAYDNTTAILNDESEPQPDAMLVIDGHQTRVDADGWLLGPAEFVAEVATSSVSYDLHLKKEMYERTGIQEYLVILVFESRAAWFVRDAGRFVELPADADGIHRSRVFPGLWFDAKAFFAGDTRHLLDILNVGLQSPEHASFVASRPSP
ncbi:MAG: Uma2 family endonuclease [Phycisphaerae bacterium]|nr:Uma2 family endonuclease [Phycisphaerae bacterium]